MQTVRGLRVQLCVLAASLPFVLIKLVKETGALPVSFFFLFYTKGT